MSAPQFTPGPWTVDEYGINCAHEHNYGVVAHARDGHCYSEYTSDPATLHFQREADARLIAAAPTMYADAEFLCARIRELEGEMTDDDEMSRQYFGHVLPAVARMEACLAEARGETE